MIIIKARRFGDEDSLYSFESRQDLIDSFPTFVFQFINNNCYVENQDELKRDIKNGISYNPDIEDSPYLNSDVAEKYEVIIECDFITPLAKLEPLD